MLYHPIFKELSRIVRFRKGPLSKLRLHLGLGVAQFVGSIKMGEFATSANGDHSSVLTAAHLRTRGRGEEKTHRLSSIVLLEGGGEIDPIDRIVRDHPCFCHIVFTKILARDQGICKRNDPGLIEDALPFKPERGGIVEAL